MATSKDNLDTTKTRPQSAVWPNSTIGWLALGFSVTAAISLVIFPLITTLFRKIYPITDTWIMPTIQISVMDLAAIINVYVVWRVKERAAMNIVAAALVIPMALLFTFMLIGETMGGS